MIGYIPSFRLRRLLGSSSAADVLVDVSRGMELPRGALHAVPDLASDGRGALGADEVVDAGLELGKRTLHVAALGKARAQEGSVEGNQDPRAALEEQGRQKEADPKQDLEARDHRHGRVVVLLDEGSDRIRSRVLRVLDLTSGLRGVAGRGDLLGRHESRDQGRANICGDMEDRVDAVREESKQVLGHEEPNQSHH